MWLAKGPAKNIRPTNTNRKRSSNCPKRNCRKDATRTVFHERNKNNTRLVFSWPPPCPVLSPEKHLDRWLWSFLGSQCNAHLDQGDTLTPIHPEDTVMPRGHREAPFHSTPTGFLTRPLTRPPPSLSSSWKRRFSKKKSLESGV